MLLSRWFEDRHVHVRTAKPRALLLLLCAIFYYSERTCSNTQASRDANAYLLLLIGRTRTTHNAVTLIKSALLVVSQQFHSSSQFQQLAVSQPLQHTGAAGVQQ